MAPPEISVTKSRTDCDLTQQMVGGIKASSPGMKSMSADMFLDLLTMSAPSGEERKLGAAAQVERAGRRCRRPDSGTHTCWGRATVMVLVSSSSGLSVGGCPGARGYFGPYPLALLKRKGEWTVKKPRSARVQQFHAMSTRSLRSCRGGSSRIRRQRHKMPV